MIYGLAKRFWLWLSGGVLVLAAVLGALWKGRRDGALHERARTAARREKARREADKLLREIDEAVAKHKAAGAQRVGDAVDGTAAAQLRDIAGRD